MLETAVVDAPSADQVQEDTNEAWIEALPARVYRTPQYGEVPITPDKLDRFITNFKQNVRGQEIATDFDHGIDSAKGLQASGWYRDFEVRPSSDDPTQMSLWAKVQFTDDAKADIKQGKYKYWSLEWDDEYETDKGDVVPDVVIGGGLTNRPVAKRTMPINFSENMWNELDEATQKQFAVWSTKYVNSLPDSSFLYIEKESASEDKGEGGETKKENRHLPYKDANGKIDLPHLRNAAARVNQIKGISADDVARIKAKIQKLLGGANKASEIASARNINMNFDDALALSEAAMEHSDPGIASPLYGSAMEQPDPGVGQTVPRVTGDPTGDPAIGGMWRRDPLPQIEKGKESDPIDIQESREGGNTMEFSEVQRNKLTKLLNIEGDDAVDPDKIIEHAETAFSELKKFKDTVGSTAQEKKFAEDYPDVWAEHQRMIAEGRQTKAKAFAESVSRISKVAGKNDDDSPKLEPTRNGLSGLALETISNTHAKFSEGTATVEDFENAITAVTNGGIVEFGEVGSAFEPEAGPSFDSSTAQGRHQARVAFAEKVAEVQAKYKKENDGAELDIVTASAKASEQYPELAAAYAATS